jgi:hypothetical protein
VKTADDDELVLNQAIEDAVGEPPQEESPCVPVDYRCSQRVSDNHLEPRLDRSQELLPKTGTLVLVPPIRPFDIGCCCRSKDR